MHPNPTAERTNDVFTNDTVIVTTTVRALTEEASDHLAGLARIIDHLEGLLAIRNGPTSLPAPRQASGPDTSSSDRKIAFLTSSMDQRLTEREQEVLGLLVQGLTNRRIARTLRIS